MTRFPRHMTLELTAKCNFRCPYCYCLWHEFPSIGSPELDTAGWRAVLDKCADDNVEDILFTGGEALLRPDIFRILSYARRRLPKAGLSLFTNASRLDESLILRFRRWRIRLATSLQGLSAYGAMSDTPRGTTAEPEERTAPARKRPPASRLMTSVMPEPDIPERTSSGAAPSDTAFAIFPADFALAHRTSSACL